MAIVAGSSTANELSKIKFEPLGDDSDDESAVGSEPESDVSVEVADVDAIYEVDAIMYAHYKDSTRVREDGYVGWHYGVMWKGYLKSRSETEEPLDVFADEGGDSAPLVEEFWRAVGRRPRPGRKEPPGRIGEFIECPSSQMKQWLKETNPRRRYTVYFKRREWQKGHAQGMVVPKRFSDYYERKRRIAKKRQRSAPAASTTLDPPPATVDATGALSPAESTPKSINSEGEVDVVLAEQPAAAEKVPQPSGKKRNGLDQPSLRDVETTRAPTAKKSKSTSRHPRPPPPPAAVVTRRLAGMGKIRKLDRPLFDDGESPTPEPTFGEPMPGIFTPEPQATPPLPEPTFSPSPDPMIPILPDEGHPLGLMDETRTSEPEMPESAVLITADNKGQLPSMSKPATPEPSPVIRSPSPPPASPPTTSQSAPLPPRTALSPPAEATKSRAPPTARAKYVQPKRVQMLDIPVTEDRDLRLKPAAGQETLSLRSETPMSPVSSRPLSSAPPDGPKGWSNVRPPTGPLSHRTQVRPPRPSSHVRPPPRKLSLLEQTMGSASNTLPVRPRDPGQPRSAPPGGISPTGSLTARSPIPYPNSSRPPLNGQGQPLNHYVAARDPRRAGAQAAPVGATLPTLPVVQSPLMQSPASDTSSRVTAPLLRNIPIPEELLQLDARLVSPLKELSGALVQIKLLRGSLSPKASDSGSLLERYLPSTPGKTACDISLEEMNAYELSGNLQNGARVVEWARAGRASEPPVWERLKVRTARTGKVYVSYTESSKDEITSHYAVILASASQVDLSLLGFGDWRQEDLSLVVLLVALPFTAACPRLPNPIKADLSAMDFDESPASAKPHSSGIDIDLEQTTASSPMKLLESYGMTADFLQTLSGRTVFIYPNRDGHTDVLYEAITSAFKQINVVQPVGDNPPDFMIIINSKISRVIRSVTIRSALPRRTQFYAVGAALQLSPRQYSLQRIWTAGGLVTFSPTLILRSPDKFGEILRMVRSAPTWGAYILPVIIQWVNESWQHDIRCPDPIKSFDTLSKVLGLDQPLLDLSGSAATSGGGLAISCCPPSVQLLDACAAWTSWLYKLLSQREFGDIVDLCQPGMITQGLPREDSKPAVPAELNLLDIEQSQFEDLIAMRSRPHVLPYRRYIYVGEISLDRTKRETFGSSIEFVAADDFAAIFSGAN